MEPRSHQSQMSLKEYAAKRAKILIGCYRKSDAADPETYAAAVVSVLVKWPVDVVTSVTEPSTGLPSKLNWLPSIAEISKACQESYAPTARRLADEKDRRALPAPIDRSQHPTMDELKAKYGQNWGLSGDGLRRSWFDCLSVREAQAMLDRAETGSARQRAGNEEDGAVQR